MTEIVTIKYVIEIGFLLLSIAVVLRLRPIGDFLIRIVRSKPALAIESLRLKDQNAELLIWLQEAKIGNESLHGALIGVKAELAEVRDTFAEARGEIKDLQRTVDEMKIKWDDALTHICDLIALLEQHGLPLPSAPQRIADDIAQRTGRVIRMKAKP